MFNLIVGLLMAFGGYLLFREPKPKRKYKPCTGEELVWLHRNCFFTRPEEYEQFRDMYGVEKAKEMALQRDKEHSRNAFFQVHGFYPEEDMRLYHPKSKENIKCWFIQEWRRGEITKEELDKQIKWVEEEYDPDWLEKRIEKMDRELYGDDVYEWRKKMGYK